MAHIQFWTVFIQYGPCLKSNPLVQLQHKVPRIPFPGMSTLLFVYDSSLRPWQEMILYLCHRSPMVLSLPKVSVCSLTHGTTDQMNCAVASERLRPLLVLSEERLYCVPGRACVHACLRARGCLRACVAVFVWMWWVWMFIDWNQIERFWKW